MPINFWCPEIRPDLPLPDFPRTQRGDIDKAALQKAASNLRSLLRTFGNYIGQYGIVMEKGLPNRGKVTIARNSGAVYDLDKHCRVPFSSHRGKTVIEVDFTTSDGKLFLLTDRPLGKLELRSPSGAKSGGNAEIRICSPDRKVLIPVQITITAPDGTPTGDSGYAVVENGVFRKRITFPENAPAGVWKITVRNLANGGESVSALTVRNQ